MMLTVNISYEKLRISNMWLRRQNSQEENMSEMADTKIHLV